MISIIVSSQYFHHKLKEFISRSPQGLTIERQSSGLDNEDGLWIGGVDEFFPCYVAGYGKLTLLNPNIRSFLKITGDISDQPIKVTFRESEAFHIQIESLYV